MNLQELKEKNLIIFECLSGSRAYGLATENSDTDIKGVYIASPEEFSSFNCQEQISDENNNVSYYELKKFLFLLSRNNPTALEMFYTPNHCVYIESPGFKKLREYSFLSKLCYESFSKYALSQIKKSTGLNKKMLNPMPKDRASILEFCFVTSGVGSLKVQDWLSKNNIDAKKCGLSKVPNFRDIYAIFSHNIDSNEYPLNGLMRSADSTELCMSKIPKNIEPLAYLSFNKDAFTMHCEQYREYWEWVEKRNPDRYLTNMEHKKNYDSKNMMHVFRLFSIAKMIVEEKTIDFNLFDREYLLKIKSGFFDHTDLLEKGEILSNELMLLYEKSDLPNFPDIKNIENLHLKMRMEFYQQRGSTS